MGVLLVGEGFHCLSIFNEGNKNVTHLQGVIDQAGFHTHGLQSLLTCPAHFPFFDSKVSALHRLFSVPWDPNILLTSGSLLHVRSLLDYSVISAYLWLPNMPPYYLVVQTLSKWWGYNSEQRAHILCSYTAYSLHEIFSNCSTHKNPQGCIATRMHCNRSMQIGPGNEMPNKLPGDRDALLVCWPHSEGDKNEWWSILIRTLYCKR